MSDLREKNEKSEGVFGEGGTFQPTDSDNAERQRNGSTIVDGRRLSRIGPPLKSGSVDLSNQEFDNEHGKLVAMEESNAIKYRTCSWQKVWLKQFYCCYIC